MGVSTPTFGVLGPLLVMRDGQEVRIAGFRERTLLALLLERAGTEVPIGQLADELWAGTPPKSWSSTVHSLVSRLRRSLEPGQSGRNAQVLVRRGNGYVVDVDREAIDACQFELLARRGHRAATEGSNDEAALAFRSGLDLWRGDAYADCASLPRFAGEVVRLEEMRLACVDAWIDAELRLGHHAEMVAVLESLVLEHPLRERLWGHLMLALYRCRRQSDALRAYQRARSVLVGELGVDPCTELEQLEARILQHDPSLEGADPTVSALLVTKPATTASDVVGTTFVGRIAELDALSEAWNDAANGRQRLVLVEGEPGVGKTRLVTEFASRLSAGGPIVLFGRADQDMASALDPLHAPLKTLAAVVPTSVSAAHVSAHGRTVAGLMPELAASLHGGGLEPWREPDPERTRAVHAIENLIAIASRWRPILLVLDDLHWAGSTALLLVRHVMRSAEPMRLLIAATFRSLDADLSDPLRALLADLRSDMEVTRLALVGFDNDETAEFLKNEAPELAIDEALAHKLNERTGGNPFFVREMVQHLASDGDELDMLPAGVTEVVTRRLMSMPDAHRRVMAAAAIIGREFDVRVLQAMVAEDNTLVFDAIDAAECSGLLEELQGRGEYRFVNELVRESLCQTASTARRTQLHLLAGRAIESVYTSRLDYRYWVVAKHYEAAAEGGGDIALAARYWLKAAAAAADRGEYPEALSAVRRGLDLLDASDPAHAELRAGLLLVATHPRLRALSESEVPNAARLAIEAARLGGSVEQLATAAVALAATPISGSVDPLAIELCEEVLRMDGVPAGARLQLEAASAMHRAWGEGWEEARRTTREVVDRCWAEGSADDRFFALFARANVLLGLPEAGELLDLGSDMVAVALEANDVAYLANAHRCHGIGCLVMGDRPGFELNLREMTRLADQIESQTFAAIAVGWHGLLALVDGRFAEAELARNELARLAEAADVAPSGLAYLLGQQAWHWSSVGRYDEVATLLRGVLEMLPDSIAFRAGLASVLAQQGDADAARANLELVPIERVAACYDINRAGSLVMLAEAVSRVADVERAAAVRDLLAPYSGQLVVVATGTHCAGAANRYLGILSSTLGDRARAEAELRSALALERSVGARPLAARTMTCLAATLLAAGGDVVEPSALLDGADAIASELGLVPVRNEVAAVRSSY